MSHLPSCCSPALERQHVDTSRPSCRAHRSSAHNLPARLPGTRPPAPAPGSTWLQPRALLSLCGSQGAAQRRRADSSGLSQNASRSGQSGSSLGEGKDHSRANVAKDVEPGLGLLHQAGSWQESSSSVLHLAIRAAECCTCTGNSLPPPAFFKCVRGSKVGSSLVSHSSQLLTND